MTLAVFSLVQSTCSPSNASEGQAFRLCFCKWESTSKRHGVVVNLKLLFAFFVLVIIDFNEA